MRVQYRYESPIHINLGNRTLYTELLTLKTSEILWARTRDYCKGNKNTRQI
jgi:hypothetical protein